MRIRIRGPSGMSQVNMPETATWGELRHEISTKTSVADFDVKYGYPPQNLDTTSIDNETKLTDVGIKLDGEQLIILPRDVQQSLHNPMSGHVDPQTHGTLPSLKNIQPPQHKAGDFPSGQTKGEQATPLSLQRKPNDVESDPPEVPVPGLEGVLVLRVMPDDNSCMFRALGSAVLGDALDAMNELRSMVAQTIQANQDLYTAGMLEKAPDDYCRWIQREDSWGGGIELAILSQQFDIEICSINVQDLRIDRFNEGKSRRCILIYSGIHYDVVAVSPGQGTSPEFDRKIFEVAQIEGMEGEDGGALQAARELCQILQQRHYFTDTHGFTIKCNVCGWTGKGEQGATEHAKQTGHMNFGEA
ncbi:OTU-domain-containing protein [Aureobasidium sp. EXF-10728]|nr:OTU-domain-containing protein [Aureobasidium sp. EXF-10728]